MIVVLALQTAIYDVARLSACGGEDKLQRRQLTTRGGWVLTGVGGSHRLQRAYPGVRTNAMVHP